MNSPGPLLSLRLTVEYAGKTGVVRDATLQMQHGEILGLVGESGSGKTTLALSILRLLGHKGGVASGEVQFEGRDLMALSEREMRQVRGREIGLVLQSPSSSLNPALRIDAQLAEAWRAHALSRQNGYDHHLHGLLESVCLPSEDWFLRRFPRQLSVGQAQRVLIAMAILHHPKLLIADEPTSSLDLITQSEILQLLARLNRELDMGILYISHDLLSVASFCHRIAILHEGQIVECGATEQVFRNPEHPYTRRLVSALPRNPF